MLNHCFLIDKLLIMQKINTILNYDINHILLKNEDANMKIIFN